MEHYDIIIIGAGLSGLYSAYNIKKMSPNSTFLILESNKKQYIGGRIGNEIFYNTRIVVGAGVGRKKKDHALLNLLSELHVPFKEYVSNMNYSPLLYNKVVNINNIILQLRQIYNKYKNKPNVTFKQFASQHLGEKLYKDFVISAGFSD
jgi:monoamine oxidase